MTDFTVISRHLADRLRDEQPLIAEMDYKGRYRQWEHDCIAVGRALSELETGNSYCINSVNEFIHACGSTKTL